MDNAGYKRDSNDEHYTDNVYDFLHVNDIFKEISEINKQESALGFVDALGNRT